MSDRRSLLSIASGIYEEIPDLPSHTEQPPPAPAPSPQHIEVESTATPIDCEYLPMGGDSVDGTVGVAVGGASVGVVEEPTYESVAECVYATMRRTGKRFPPPPLPPRVPFGTSKFPESWSSCGLSGVTRHGSVGSLPHERRHPRPAPRELREHSRSPHETKSASSTLPHNSTFSVFRKRLKSDSRVASSPKSDSAKDNKTTDTKKKKFDFTPTRDIFKNFKVGRKMKNLKISVGSLSKGETKSCEFLDETEHVTTSRCSKSVECLEDNFIDDFDGDLSIEFNDEAVAALALPQEIVDLILRGRETLTKIRLKDAQESDYMPMSPIVPPPPIEHHYIVMSTKTNIA